jgi:hypothetical protein
VNPNLKGENFMSEKKFHGDTGLFSSIYGLAFIGAAVYYIQQATTFLAGLVGFLKALVWPAFLMYKVLELLKM